jgi:serine/threonine protein kinase
MSGLFHEGAKIHLDQELTTQWWLRFDGEYELGAELGAGHFGSVYKIHDRFSPKVLKITYLCDTDAVKRYSRVRHPALTPIHAVACIRENPLYYAFLMPYLPGHTIPQLGYMRLPQSEETIMQLLREPVDGVSKLHDNGLVYGDFKPGNIQLVDDKRPQLLDMDNVRYNGFRGQHPSDIHYAPPYSENECSQYAIDAYMIGMSMLRLRVGHPVYKNPEVSLKSVIGQLPQIGATLEACLDDRVERRPLVSEIAACLAGHMQFSGFTL